MPSKKHLSSFILHPSSFLFFLAILTYALFFWERGFYWDEAPWTWVYYQLGPAALAELFSTSRPFWGLFYQALMPLIGPHPWAWQLLMVFLRWLTAVLVWLILRQLFPASRLPLWAAALFLVYPGLGQNFIALMYSHFYIIFCAFLASLYLTILAARRRSVPLHILALLLSVVNLLTLEYFYFLELFRFALLFIILQRDLKRTSLTFFPYLLLFLTVTVWRAFFFTNQNASYGYATLQAIRENVFMGIFNLLGLMLRAFWETVLHTWLFPFEMVDITALGLYTAIAAFALAVVVTLTSSLYLRHWGATTPARGTAPETGLPASKLWDARTAFLILGLLAWILGGGAFWLVGERTMPQLHFSADRFTMPFMLGSSLIVAALIGWLAKWPKLQYTLLALLIGFSVGKQFQTNATYRRDWDTTRSLFWQMSWRIPAMQPGTAVLSNDLPLTVLSDNSLTGPLNWIYDPLKAPTFQPFNLLGQGVSRPNMNYILYFVSVRAQAGRALGDILQPGQPIEQNYLATVFHGNTSSMVVVNFSPPGCFRVLDPQIDPLNRLLPPQLRDAAALGNPAMILPETRAALPDFYNPELVRGWCYYFSKAELARQLGDWDAVNQLAGQAFALGDHPNDPLENFVFIEGYAHAGDWDLAQELTKSTYRFSKEYLRPTLCKLWERIQTRAPGDAAKTAVVQLVQNELKCASLPQP